MSLQALQQIFGTIVSHIPGVSANGLSYYIALAGMAILLTFVITGVIILLVKAFRATWNLTPSGFLKLLLTLGIILIIVGIVVP
ncbi:hypothetical protein Calag_0048 [Caldisphaera lagunensis DSM 15908]|uniref:Uncharacterized protein n=1 Tax=Caldisphaera lagunensis (strain DSM 15908 / JCM 11604 / ANMR 0165 / IC-154) TaxID=1056495 RepID=L0A9V8_CALLD|nr:hypothetical protein [Caldisphaera lagunensis]AFZ69840.1 hypothetical protein Calag_0048 [Caldisphaera lagunensis DSM 15908]